MKFVTQGENYFKHFFFSSDCSVCGIVWLPAVHILLLILYKSGINLYPLRRIANNLITVFNLLTDGSLHFYYVSCICRLMARFLFRRTRVHLADR